MNHQEYTPIQRGLMRQGLDSPVSVTIIFATTRPDALSSLVGTVLLKIGCHNASYYCGRAVISAMGRPDTLPSFIGTAIFTTMCPDALSSFIGAVLLNIGRQDASSC